MQKYLVLFLYGPMSSWGHIAVGEYRPTHDRPTKSSILGMLAAALGIKRNEESRIKELARSLGFSVCVHQPGLLLRDYHTVQIPGESRNTIYHTRKDELKNDNLNTLLSTRDYRSDGVYTVALWQKIQSSFTLEEIGRALKKPAFILYLGRKSCPPSLPLEPKIVEAETLEELYKSIAFNAPSFLLPSEKFEMVYWDDHPNPGFKETHTVSRRDDLFNRARWQFSDRREHYAPIQYMKEA
ncbi:MAG: type I-E CRISPR-associated protein Cas5/CasD [Planctomycetes bacterium]|nr:type I-E CRISPR-associated protein Cas5/CasD [Planctomycetota bacterium]